MSDVHVTPRNDLAEHPASSGCPCRPSPVCVEGEAGQVNWMYIHHSLDGRELEE